ncbi:hypothetical protein ILT44_24290 [Microvirga sp. BT689]|uniref:hypothetical protein n=1 Tax=Microvirga arvi TaxID=2778731 RepID=UPI00194F5C16|nr:hypothetical protein [Microvirga arvi]MBM6583326.1 hypothetical protein [Microvirga arvi]
MLGGDRSLISDIYETAIVPERWLDVFEQISAIAGADRGFMAALTPRGERSWLATERYQQDLSDWYAEGWHLQNTWAERGHERKRLQFFDETDIFAPGELNSIPMYRDFHHPRGGGWSAGALMQLPGDGGVCFRFERPYHQGPMEQDVRERLNRLRPHLAHAAFLFSKLGLRQARSAASALQLMDIPAAVLTRNGQLLACNMAMQTRLSQVSTLAGDRIAFTNNDAQRTLSEGLARITAGLFDQLRGPIPIPATEEDGPAVAYLIPMRGAAQDLFGCETTLLMIRPDDSKNALMNLVRTRFVIDAGEAQRWARLLGMTCPRLAAALLVSTENIQTTLDQWLGRTQMRLEARLAGFLWKLGNDPELHLTKPRVH